MDRPLTHTAVDQIEKGIRRVDVDDLMALAAALDVSPAALLMPSGQQNHKAVVTGHRGKVTCGRVWDWIVGLRPTRDVAGGELLAWLARSRPSWTIEMAGYTPRVRVSDGDG